MLRRLFIPVKDFHDLKHMWQAEEVTLTGFIGCNGLMSFSWPLCVFTEQSWIYKFCHTTQTHIHSLKFGTFIGEKCSVIETECRHRKEHYMATVSFTSEDQLKHETNSYHIILVFMSTLFVPVSFFLYVCVHVSVNEWFEIWKKLLWMQMNFKSVLSIYTTN